jgi:hypothetical protein
VSVVLRVRSQVLALGHVQPHPETFAQPARIAEMIRVKVCDHYAGKWRTAERLCQYLIPQRTRFIEPDPAVHRGPAIRLANQPEIDMVERKGQRHAQPQHPGRDLEHRAGCRRRRLGESERGGRVGGCRRQCLGHGNSVSWKSGDARRAVSVGFYFTFT